MNIKLKKIISIIMISCMFLVACSSNKDEKNKKLWYNFSKKFWLKGEKEKKDGNKLFRTGSRFEAKFVL